MNTAFCILHSSSHSPRMGSERFGWCARLRHMPCPAYRFRLEADLSFPFLVCVAARAPSPFLHLISEVP